MCMCVFEKERSPEVPIPVEYLLNHSCFGPISVLCGATGGRGLPVTKAREAAVCLQTTMVS